MKLLSLEMSPMNFQVFIYISLCILRGPAQIENIHLQTNDDYQIDNSFNINNLSNFCFY